MCFKFRIFMKRYFYLCIFTLALFSNSKDIETPKPNGCKGAALCHDYRAQEGVGIFVYAGLVAQQARITGAIYAHTANGEPFLPDHEAEVLRPDFKMNLGFNGGIGYRYFHDNWSLGLDYTYLKSTADKCLSDCNCDSFYVPDCIWCHDLYDITNHIDPSDSDEPPTTCFVITLYDLNLMLERASYTSDKLSVVPAFGIKSTWIEYDDSTDYCSVYGYYNCCASVQNRELPSFISHRIQKCEHADFYGIGPQFGLDAKWHITQGFSFFSDFDAALLMGRFKICNSLYVDGDKRVCINDGFSTVSPFIGLNLGIEYGSSFRNNTLFASARLGYDNSVYFNQYNRICYTGICSLKENQNNTYSLTGIKFTVGLDF